MIMNGNTMIALVVALTNIYAISGQATIMPPTVADFSNACALFNTTFTCARAVGAICVWDSASNACMFRSTSCPADLKSSMVAISDCGATLNMSCPQACMQPQITFMARLHFHAGLHNYTTGDQLITKASTNVTIAQAVADVQYCTTLLSMTQYTNMLYEGCMPTADQINSAIATDFAVSTSAPTSSASPSSGSSGINGSVTTNAAGSAAALAINTLINGLALGLIILYTAGL